MEFRDYQRDIIEQGTKVLSNYRIVYLAMMVRTGKTFTSLGIADNMDVSSVLFITKKKAIKSIQDDYKALSPGYTIMVTNYESVHKIKARDYDLIIVDESHSCFLGNTLIDGVKIKDIKVGSFQKSFNFTNNTYEYKKVLNKYKNKLDKNLIKIKCNGKEIICTEDHKIFTKRGWIKAGEILPTDELQVV